MRFGAATEAAIAEFQAADVSYDHVGSTLASTPPATARRIEATVAVGAGAPALAAGRHALRDWVPQRSLAMTVAPAGVAPDLGETVVLGLGVGQARILIPNRIVSVIDEPDRYGYVYGSLPGHPERGEELFLVELGPDDQVRLTIRADSRPAGSLRAVAPLVELAQRFALRRYLAATARDIRRS